MQKKYGPKGFTVVSVSNDESVKEAGAFAREVKATFPVLHDPKNVMFKAFGDPAMPANVVVDRKGKIVASIEGAKIKAIEAAITKSLQKK